MKMEWDDSPTSPTWRFARVTEKLPSPSGAERIAIPCWTVVLSCEFSRASLSKSVLE